LNPKVDVCVVGGGVSGLSTALELRQRGRSVVVLSRDLAQSATRAAGGMLAPQSERLEAGPLLDLCVEARAEWPKWAESSLGTNAPSIRAVGGFISPCSSASDPIASWTPVASAGPAEWLDGTALAAMEPCLSGGRAQMFGGWWYPLDCSVDPIETHLALYQACEQAGIIIRTGVEVAGLDLTSKSCDAVRLSDGSRIHAGHICLANGAWLRSLLPVPIYPQKGQMLRLERKSGANAPPPPDRVIYANGCYLIPRGNDLIVGATVEDSDSPHADIRGVSQLLDSALSLCPGLASWSLADAWAGLRPNTLDSNPILGPTRWQNLWVAGGYWRNGILLAPRAARLVVDAMDGKYDNYYLDAFRWDRFFQARTPESSRFIVNRSPPSSSDNNQDQGGYESIVGRDQDTMADARRMNRATLFQKYPESIVEEHQAVQQNKDEGGYEAILGRAEDTMAEARRANRATLFGTASIPHPTTNVKQEIPEPNPLPLTDFKMWKALPDGSPGEQIFYQKPPPELRIGKTAADEICELQTPIVNSPSALPDKSLASDKAKVAEADRLYESIRQRRQHSSSSTSFSSS